MSSKRVSKDYWSHLASSLTLAGLPPQRWTCSETKDSPHLFLLEGTLNANSHYPFQQGYVLFHTVLSFVSTQLIWRACTETFLYNISDRKLFNRAKQLLFVTLATVLCANAHD